MREGKGKNRVQRTRYYFKPRPPWNGGGSDDDGERSRGVVPLKSGQGVYLAPGYEWVRDSGAHTVEPAFMLDTGCDKNDEC
jgi:hypothetical protein